MASENEDMIVKSATGNEPTSASDSKENADEFTPFPRLPIELRGQIWKEAVDDLEPRVVELYFDGPLWATMPASQTSSPALLRACKESRENALKRYQKLILQGTATSAMIDFSQDALFLNVINPSTQILDLLNDDNLRANVRRLAMPKSFFYDYIWFTPTITRGDHYKSHISRFDELEELLLVVQPAEYAQPEGQGFRFQSFMRDIKVQANLIPSYQSKVPQAEQQPLKNFGFIEAKGVGAKFEAIKNHLRYALVCNSNVATASLVQIKAKKGSDPVSSKHRKHLRPHAKREWTHKQAQLSGKVAREVYAEESRLSGWANGPVHVTVFPVWLTNAGYKLWKDRYDVQCEIRRQRSRLTVERLHGEILNLRKAVARFDLS